MHFVNELIRLRRLPIVGPVARQALYALGPEIPPSVSIGVDLNTPHRARGAVVSGRARIGDRVTLYHGVTIGRVSPDTPSELDPSWVIIGNDVCLSAYSMVLFGKEGLTVGDGTLLAANSVLTCSTGTWEVWAGMPARLVGVRERPSSD